MNELGKIMHLSGKKGAGKVRDGEDMDMCLAETGFSLVHWLLEAKA